MYLTRLRRKLGAALLLCAGLMGAELEAQGTYSIQGTVVDATSRRALAGVTVALRGQGARTVTDNGGRYTLTAAVPAGSYSVVFTQVGRGEAVRAVTLGDSRAVQLGATPLSESALQLEALVVTGSGVETERKAIGNAVSTVNAEQLAGSGAQNIDAALSGKIAGAQVNLTSGTPGAGASVRLRGTSSIIGGAEPLYIVDGVIIDNSSDQLINFGYRSNPTNRLADLNPNDIERVEVLKGAAAAALYGSRANNGVIQIFTRRGRAGRPQVSVGQRVGRSELTRRLNFNDYPFNEKGEPVQRFDNQDFIFRDALTVETNASVSGGSEGTQYFLSADYADQEGIMRGSDFQKIGVRLNLDQSVGGWLRLSGGANYVTSEASLVTNGEQGVGGLLTSIVFTPTDVDLRARDPETGRYRNAAFVFPNPLEVIETWQAPQDVSRFVGSFQARATPIEGGSLEFRMGYDTYSQETSLYIPRGSAAAGAPLGSAQAVLRNQYLLNNDLVGNYRFGLGALQLTSTAGVNHTYTNARNVVASASDLTLTTELVRGAQTTSSQNRFETATLGIFGQQQVGWRDRLYLTGALRADAASTFGADERWQLYPKVSGSYLVSEEPFWENSVLGRWFDSFRVRAALGYAGSQPGGAYDRFSLYNQAVNITRQGLVHSPRAGNPSLKPERQREVEAGFDASFLDERLGVTFTYYDQYVTDLLLPRPFTPSTGYFDVLDNVGELSNRGMELELRSTNVDRPRFGWNTTFIYSHNRNRVEKLAGTAFASTSGYPTRVAEGYALGEFWMPTFRRDSAGNILLNEAGNPLPSLTPEFVGSPWPDFNASLTNEFRVGSRLTAGFQLDGAFGQQVWNQTRRIMDRFQAGELYERQLRGEVTNAYRLAYFGIQSEYLEDGSYVKLREASLRYNAGRGLARAIGAGNLQFELIGRNLHTWTEYTGYDPEINLFGAATAARGIDFAVYPVPRTVTLGMRATY
ncbi:MAG: Outer membrane TonB-dependent transporter, utilization system for glycans and polysaccharides (PUL), SusC family [uncultured Gemmatimonadetes bacterium]|uniref:Outer membrane TonB-dependent transporter, utilization system for glycans and polysaccharides (PUL), SusC family n=1 Tax=uncultured Gemmatimonadota bacterium TaxID=203437 RepID=A0A6J4LTS9_9BACT|nr:MAG: Outer membrane TonB-dependent transporter, utilization system for glycans and polysaccharides (PUL), SusC family [uncultured Gemmatimonadota bacterium]